LTNGTLSADRLKEALMGLHLAASSNTTPFVLALIGTVAAVCSTLVALFALYVGVKVTRVESVDVNSWEMYRSYNSEAVRLGRATAREALKVRPHGFRDSSDYDAYFLPGNLPADYVLPSGVTPARMQQLREQSMHDLMAFYHQVGLMLQRRGLDKDFTLLLIGGGLQDRWGILEGLPTLWSAGGAYPYGDMYALYRRFLRWQRGRFRWIRWRYDRARKQIMRLQTRKSVQ
jgi:hypothetical protein